MRPDLADIVYCFQFLGTFVQAEPIKFGHINDTYTVRCRKPDGCAQRYILQRINHHVFRDPEKVMQNIQGVTTHLRQKVLAAGGDPERETLNLISTVQGQSFFRTPGGEYWRAYAFIEKAKSYEVAENLERVYSAANAFGRFQAFLNDYPAVQLHETIPDFHHTRKRLEAFVRSVERDVTNRAASAKAEIAFIERRADRASILLDLLAQGRLPQRVTHNDTKFNNVLIDDDTGEGICVIDLDTVMPGLSLYDFGDAVRSGTNSAAEDEQDLSKVAFDLAIFRRLVQGYLDATRDLLTPLEIDYLSFSCILMTLECGMRFLTDYLDGNIYFKVSRPRHNLDRCRTQLRLIEEMEARFDQMIGIVEAYR